MSVLLSSEQSVRHRFDVDVVVEDDSEHSLVVGAGDLADLASAVVERARRDLDERDLVAALDVLPELLEGGLVAPDLHLEDLDPVTVERIHLYPCGLADCSYRIS